jgi:hypothetical protein
VQRVNCPFHDDTCRFGVDFAASSPLYSALLKLIIICNSLYPDDAGDCTKAKELRRLLKVAVLCCRKIYKQSVGSNYEALVAAW